MNIELIDWAINILVFSLLFSWNMMFQMYKDLKKKNKIINIQENILRDNGLL